MSTTITSAIETHIVHREYFDAIVEITDDGTALLSFKEPDGGPLGDVKLDGEDLAAIDELWRRATRADD